MASFYKGLRSPVGLDKRNKGDFGRAVIETCEKIIEKAKVKGRVTKPAVPLVAGFKPSVLVIGGTGFIGRELIRQLLEAGHSVRAAGRAGSPALEELSSDRLEIARADIRSETDLARVLRGSIMCFTSPRRETQRPGTNISRVKLSQRAHWRERACR